jgi:hypothetical protein
MAVGLNLLPIEGAFDFKDKLPWLLGDVRGLGLEPEDLGVGLLDEMWIT